MKRAAPRRDAGAAEAGGGIGCDHAGGLARVDARVTRPLGGGARNRLIDSGEDRRHKSGGYSCGEKIMDL